MEQLTIFDEMCDKFSITKPIRLIELFAGYGSQAMALERHFEAFKRECEKWLDNIYRDGVKNHE